MQISSLSSHIPMPAAGVSPKSGGNFASLIAQYTQQVNHDVKHASQGATALAAGHGGDTTETLLAVQKAGLSFQLMLATRNKLVDAYREVSRMQV
ncbi:MAG: flagellar hook-basal body complex protein FliE [Mariprofundales bacterium]|nr:flagellar hook-basal body complex protein FliE [Mariprofundales bacterium]